MCGPRQPCITGLTWVIKRYAQCASSFSFYPFPSYTIVSEPHRSTGSAQEKDKLLRSTLWLPTAHGMGSVYRNSISTPLPPSFASVTVPAFVASPEQHAIILSLPSHNNPAAAFSNQAVLTRHQTDAIRSAVLFFTCADQGHENPRACARRRSSFQSAGTNYCNG
jgi:hypothetical protein